MKRRSHATSGFTLIELMISVGIGVFLILVATSFSTDHVRILSRTTSRVDVHQSARLAAELIEQDVRHAGFGAGYGPSGNFSGLLRGSFTAGGAAFNSNNRAISLAWGNSITDDIGIHSATGDVRTIAHYVGGFGQICAGGRFKINDRVVLMTREGLHAHSVRLTNVGPVACIDGSCLKGCTAFAFNDDNTFVSDADATSASYTDGEMSGAFEQIVYFVAADAEGRGQLRRRSLADPVCGAPDTSCGGLVAEGVESLQLAVFQWDADSNSWVDQTVAGSISDRRRMRVDLELVLRGKTEETGELKPPIALQLAPGRCQPEPCSSKGDQASRWVLRTSIEVKNSGRMELN